MHLLQHLALQPHAQLEAPNAGRFEQLYSNI